MKLPQNPDRISFIADTKAAGHHLDYSVDCDAWGQEKFHHSHIEAMYNGWQIHKSAASDHLEIARNLMQTIGLDPEQPYSVEAVLKHLYSKYEAKNTPERLLERDKLLREHLTELVLREWKVRGLETQPVGMKADAYAELALKAINDFGAKPKRQWFKGAPQHPWNTEPFIALTEHGKLVLTGLDAEHSYDFTTADHTYLKKESIFGWMQFPDSQYIAPPQVLSGDSQADIMALLQRATSNAAAYPESDQIRQAGYLFEQYLSQWLKQGETAKEKATLKGWRLGVIGNKHFGNPIPSAWYDAAHELGDALQVSVELVSALDKYVTANYPDAEGADPVARAIAALERMDMDLGQESHARSLLLNAWTQLRNAMDSLAVEG